MPDSNKQAGIIVHLIEELGDARLRCDQLITYVAEAVRLIEDSPHKEHFFEVAGHLLHAAPVTLQRLQKSLQAVALAANRMDYEELKNDLRPEKVQQMEKALEDVRIRQIHRRSEPPMITPQYVAKRLRQIAATTREFQLPQSEVAKFIVELEGGPKQAKEAVPFSDMLDKFAAAAESGNKDYLRLAAILRRMVGDVHVKGTLAALREEPVQAAETWKADTVASVDTPNLKAAAADEAALMDRMVKATEQQLKEMKSSLSKYKADPNKNKPQLGNFKDAVLQVHKVSKMVLQRAFDVKLASDDDDKQSRFEEGKPADPTKNMSPEDAKKWKEEKERNKDKFKAAAAAAEAWKA